MLLPSIHPDAPPSADIHGLAFGAGVQSTALLLLVANKDHRLLEAMEGVLPSVAIFADPGAEEEATYEHVARCRGYARLRGVELVTVRSTRKKGLLDALQTGKRFSTIPAFTKSKTGSKGMLRRCCTADYKISPIATELRRRIGKQRILHTKHRVDIWLGISTDEIQRMKPELHIKWQTRQFPLIEMGWSRDDCHAYLEAKGWGDVPKSACVFCPYASDKRWARLKALGGDDWQRVLDAEAGLKDAWESGRGSLRDEPFLHTSLEPIDSIDFGPAPSDDDTLGNECDGYCGL